MTPWEIVQATAGPLGRVWLHMLMGATPHLGEGGFSGLPDGKWGEYNAKGVRVVDLGDRTTPYTSWKKLEAALLERVAPEPLSEAWETHRAAWRTYLDLIDPRNDALMREALTDDLRERHNAAHRAQYRTEQVALAQLREAIASPSHVPGEVDGQLSIFDALDAP